MWVSLILPMLLISAGHDAGRRDFPGGLPALSQHETQLAADLKRDLHKLCKEIGERNSLRYKELVASAEWIEAELKAAGYAVSRQPYKIDKQTYWNVIAEKRGTKAPDQIVVIGAHYDSVRNCAGADDNGTGVVAMLALARAARDDKPDRTLRFVAFVNEEPPFFQTRDMGSLIYARACKAKNERIVAMLCLETMGYFSDARGSQRYPFPLNLLYGSTGDYIAMVSNNASRDLLAQTHAAFVEHATIPALKATAPEFIEGVGWSDHWSFWQMGWPGVMITDTAPFRYPHYHTVNDTVDKIDYPRLARVVAGLEHVLRKLCQS